MKKKVAILTQPLHTNYGGTLQAYALQRTIKSFGFPVETIDFQWKKSSDFKKILSSVKNRICNGRKGYHLSNAEVTIISREHRKFILENINRSPSFYNHFQLEEYIINGKFTDIIVGSDQVWRIDYSPRIESFFLDFLKNNKTINKITYAASFGLDKWQFSENITHIMKESLASFRAVSVRENNAIELCNKNLNIQAIQVLDPTLLLTKKDYENIAKKSTANIEQGKIFYYILDMDSEKENILNKVCSILGKDFFSNQPNKTRKENFFVKDYSDYIYPSIESWIASFAKADFIITDSFHGTVFSIIFNKPFISITNKNRGNSRFDSLLSQFDLKYRLVNNVNDVNDVLVNEKVEYDEVNEKINILRKKSLQFLKDNLGCM